MRRLFTIADVVLAAGSVIFARSGMQAPGQEPEPEKKLIDLKSDNMGPIAPGDSVIFLVGNFAAQHNGAVITCDSAVRYSDMRIEFFGNVLINKNTTYIYGDRAEYNGELNEARVYSDIVKVVDGDATLYTYRFVFNTKENIGQFADGGVLINRDNRLESVRGYYYANTKDLVCVDRVEMRNDEYELKGDSVVYNMATDNAFFFENTNIWNKDGDYLYADRGSYDKADTLYIVTRNGYILTEKQEIWSDSLHYYRAEDHVILRRDLQLDDTEHKVLAFGDYGEYWKEPGDIFLTRRPSVVSYDLHRAIRSSCVPTRCSSLRSMRMPGAGQRRRPRPIRLRVWGPIPCNGPIRWGSIPMDWPRRPAPRRDVPSPDCIPATQPIRSRRPAGRIRSPQVPAPIRGRMVRRGRIRCAWPIRSPCRAACPTRWTGLPIR